MIHALTIVVLVLTGTVAKPAHTYRMHYPTQYTCDEAAINFDANKVKFWYASKHKGKTVVAVRASCQPLEAPSDRQCDITWRQHCSDAMFIS